MAYIGEAYPGYNQLIIPARFLLLNSTMIPISLKLTIDLCKLFYAKFIDADLHLYDEESDTPAHSNSTALSEDLGQVKYVLTDKTGTLTENKMVLKVAVVGRKAYGSVESATSASNLDPALLASMPRSLSAAAKAGMLADTAMYSSGHAGDGAHLDWLRCLALNNDVVPAPAKPDASSAGASEHGHHGSDRPVYKASSPDEEALVKAAAAYGVALWERVGDVVHIDLYGTRRESYTQLAAFEFTSDRKRMSVLLRDNATGAIRLYCKGADDMVMARLAAGQDSMKAYVQERVNDYAAAGLRTLVYGYRDVSASEYAQWKASYDQAAAAMENRDEAKEAVYALMEVNIVLLGATAIEDKLQDGVPDTIALLKAAGVSFWMLTGDKFSTAKTIAETSRLKPVDTDLIELEGEESGDVIDAVEKIYHSLTAVGHDLRFDPPQTTAAMLKDILTLNYVPREPPRPFTSSTAAGAASSASTSASSSDADGGSAPVTSRSNPLREAATRGTARKSADGVGETVNARDENGAAVIGMPPMEQAKRPYTIIVRGSTLEVALRVCREKFAAVCCGADSVICCRVTPKQKGQLVRVVKDAGHLTLAIGDGGNDVAMIQEAAVGVGIRGKEGLQAARAGELCCDEI